MAKFEPPTVSASYRARAGDMFQGMGWFLGLGWFTYPQAPFIGVVLCVLGTGFMVAGVVMYIFTHQSKMLEAEDQMKMRPPSAPPASN